MCACAFEYSTCIFLTYFINHPEAAAQIHSQHLLKQTVLPFVKLALSASNETHLSIFQLVYNPENDSLFGKMYEIDEFMQSFEVSTVHIKFKKKNVVILDR